MRKLTLLCVLNLTVTLLYGQVEFHEHLPYNGNFFNALVVKIEPNTIKKFSILENTLFQTHREFLTYQQNINPNFFITNASISDSMCRPIGYYINNHREIQPVNLRDGSGNFFLKPNGALILTDNDAIICNSEQISNYKNIYIGIQSGPMLISNDVINPQFNVNSNNKYVRCGVGAYTNKINEIFLVFIISENPVTFYEFASIFRNKFKCANALCLESAGSAFSLPNFTANPEVQDAIICNYIYLKL